MTTAPSAPWPTPRRRRTWRRQVSGIVLLLVVGALSVRGCAIQGWWRPIRVASGSMAGDLYGPHVAATCPECDFAFRVGDQYVPRADPFTCPNCGCPQVAWDDAPRRRGRRVWIDRWTRWSRRLRSWQPVAYLTGSDHHTHAVKRIVASGPGRLEIRQGDVFLDGQIQRKRFDQLQAMHILVHDDQYRPVTVPPLPPRWQPRTQDSSQPSCWHPTDTGYRFVAPPGAQQLEWLQYTQWTCWHRPWPPAARTHAQPVLDHYAYNQNVSRAALNPVSDLEIHCQLATHGTGRVVLQIHDGLDCFELEIACPAATVQLTHNGETLQAELPLPHPAAPDAHRWVSLARCDQQLFVQVDNTLVIARAFTPRAGPRDRAFAPAALGAAALQAEVRQLKIYRDIHYFGPRGEAYWVAPQPLQADQYFLIGDNVPVSLDSRQTGPIAGQDLLGLVLPR